MWSDSAIDGSDGEVLSGAQSLSTFRAVTVDETDELKVAGFLPEGLRQAPVKDFGTRWGWSTGVDGADNIVEFAKIFLPNAAAFALDPGPVGVIIISMAIDAFGFEAFHGSILGQQQQEVQLHA